LIRTSDVAAKINLYERKKIPLFLINNYLNMLLSLRYASYAVAQK
jgi:hypothetical protein